MDDFNNSTLAYRKILAFSEIGKTRGMCLVGKIKNSNLNTIS